MIVGRSRRWPSQFEWNGATWSRYPGWVVPGGGRWGDSGDDLPVRTNESRPVVGAGCDRVTALVK